MKMLYYTMVQPYLSYCNIIWGNACQSNLTGLLKLQKRAIRLITRSEYRAHSSPLFLSQNILKLSDIYNVQVLLFMYKCRYNLLPTSRLNLVSLVDADTRYRFRKPNDFTLIGFKTEWRRKSIAVAGPRLWNTIPIEIKELYSLSMFKHAITSMFIERYV